jgi:hypothetical protein
MFDALVCYVFNIYAEIPKLCKMLDKVVREVVQNQTIDEMRVQVENLFPSIESFLKSRDDLMPPSKFAQVDPSTYQADPLTLFSEARPRNRTNQVRYLQTEGGEYMVRSLQMGWSINVAEYRFSHGPFL